jgi:hypothetical protein
MTVPQSSLLSRVAVNSMDLALRFWPESSRRWGQAVLAEMGEISEPGAALNWAAGGILLFFRALAAHFLEWMKLPAGARFSGAGVPGGGNGPNFPKHSRLVTAVILLAAVALLFLPIGREAATTVKESWRGFEASPGDRRDLEKIAARAEAEKDARELAFVALSYPDADRAMQFADGAVALDPNLMWIYASRSTSQEDRLKNPDRLKRLKGFDPGNATVHLVSASVESSPIFKRTIEQGRGGNPESIIEALASDKDWREEMDLAFLAPRYDGYFQRHVDLVREGWRKNPKLPPGLIATGVWTHSVPDFGNIREYADLRVSEALRAGAGGNPKEAETILGQITDFGNRMTAGSPDFFEHSMGIGVKKRGLEGFRQLYRANGQADKEKEIEAQLIEIKTNEDARVTSYIGWRTDVMNGFKWKATAVQISAVLALFLGIAIVFSLLMLEAGAAFRWKASGAGRWIACRVADYGPVLFLGASVFFLISFRPLAELFEQYRSAEQANAEAMGLFWRMYVLGDANPLAYFYNPYHQWLIGTIALAAIAVIVVARGWVRRKAIAGR